LARRRYASSFSGCETGGDDPDGDGDECTPNPQFDQPKALGDPGQCGCGDPIDFATGNKYEAEVDYAGAGPLPLILARYYNSSDTTGVVHRFGLKWRGSYNRTLTFTSATVVTATRDDSKVLTFNLVNGVWTPDADVNYRLTTSGPGWSLVTDQDETETYNASGQLVTYANRAGLTQTFGRDSQGRLVTVVDPFGRTLTFTWASTAPVVTKVTAPDGGVYAYGYDADNHLVSVTFPDSSQRQYVYENPSFFGKVTGVIDEKGNRYSTTAYDSTGRANSTQLAGGVGLTTIDYSNFVSVGEVDVTGPLGAVMAYSLTSVTGSAKLYGLIRNCSNCYYVGNAANYVYDSNGNLTEYLDFDGNATVYTYDTTRNLEISRTLASGTSIARTISTTWSPTYRLPTKIVDGTRTVANVYDPKGNLLSSTLTFASVTSTRSFTYNNNGQALTATDPLGNVTTYAYDAKGDMTSATNALGQTRLFTSYDANGRPLAIQDPNGVVTTLTYNFRGQVTSKTVGVRITVYAYDAVGDLIKVTQPDGSFLAMSYDAAHRLVGIADALGDTIAYTLDAAGNRLKTNVNDPSNTLVQTHSRVYDGLSRIYQDIGAAQQTATFYYDDNDNLNYFYNPLSIQTYNVYDALNRVTQTSKDGAYTYFAYDTKSRLDKVTDPRGLATNYAHDGLDDLTSIGSPDTGTTTNTYDAAGNLVTSIDAVGRTTTYSYDAINRVTKQSVSGGSLTTFQYDQGTYGIGRLTEMADPTGTTVWGYNRYGQVILCQQTTGGVTLTTRWAYTANTGQLATLTYPSGATLSYAYNANGQTSSIAYTPAGGGAAASLVGQIAYQPFGPVASWLAGNGATYHRTYDKDGRVTGIALPAGVSIGLTYDADSRITGMTETALPNKTFSYNGLDRLTGFGSGSLTKSYSYDVAGNRTGFNSNTPSTSLTYAYASTSNRLTAVSGSWAETYSYDADGNVTAHQTPQGGYAFGYNLRNRQTLATFGTATRTFQYNGLGQRVAKLDNGAFQTLFVYDRAGHLLGAYNPNGSPIEETVWLGDLPVAALAAGGPYYVAPDHLGAPHQITNSGKNVVWYWDHDPFGNGAPTGAFTYNLRFPGQFYDSSDGLHYNYFRDYDPAKGRYVESDPIGLLGGGLNTYGYVGEDPVSQLDLTGLKDEANDPPDPPDPTDPVEGCKKLKQAYAISKIPAPGWLAWITKGTAAIWGGIGLAQIGKYGYDYYNYSNFDWSNYSTSQNNRGVTVPINIGPPDPFSDEDPNAPFSSANPSTPFGPNNPNTPFSNANRHPIYVIR
jgi:RHS repeat-associated protein